MKTRSLTYRGISCTLLLITSVLFIPVSPARVILAAEEPPKINPGEDQGAPNTPSETPAQTPISPNADVSTATDLGLISNEETPNKLTWSLGGTIQSDVRFRIWQKGISNDFYLGKDFFQRTLPTGVERNQNLLNVRGNASYGRFMGVVDIDFAWLGYPEQIRDLPGLSDITQVDPFYLKVHSLYFQGKDMIVNGLDLSIGQQTILWGKGDQLTRPTISMPTI